MNLNRELKLIQVGDLTWTHGAQRLELPTKSDLRRFTDWDDRKVGAGIASERDGVIFPLDGRTRAWAAKEKFGPHYRMPFVVYTGLTPQDEATIFDAVNNARKNPTAMDSFMAGLYGNVSPYVEINEVLMHHGLGPAKTGSNKRVGAIKALQTIWEKDKGKKHLLDQTLTALHGAYGYDDVRAWDSAILQAVAHLIWVNPQIDLERLVATLAQRPAGQWKTAGMVLIGHGGGSVSRAYPIAQQIASVYNLRLRNAAHRISHEKRR